MAKHNQLAYLDKSIVIFSGGKIAIIRSNGAVVECKSSTDF